MTEDTSNKSLTEKETLPLRDSRGRFVKGSSGNVQGKPAGAISKLGRLRNYFLQVFDQMGGAEGLLNWAKENRSEFYQMIFKLVPKGDILFQIRSTLSCEERLQMVLSGSPQPQEDQEEDEGGEGDEGEDFEDGYEESS